MERKEYSFGLWEALLVLFIGLKLSDIIDWPWIMVLCPILIPAAFGLICIIPSLKIERD